MFVLGKPFQPSLLFVAKPRSLPLSGAPQRYFNRVGPCVANIHQTVLERFARDQRSTLLRTLVNYDHKKFYDIGPRKQIETIKKCFFRINKFEKILSHIFLKRFPGLGSEPRTFLIDFLTLSNGGIHLGINYSVSNET